MTLVTNAWLVGHRIHNSSAMRVTQLIRRTGTGVSESTGWIELGWGAGLVPSCWRRSTAALYGAAVPAELFLWEACFHTSCTASITNWGASSWI